VLIADMKRRSILLRGLACVVGIATLTAIVPDRAHAFVSPGYAPTCRIPGAMIGAWKGISWRRDGVEQTFKSVTFSVGDEELYWKRVVGFGAMGMRITPLRPQICNPWYVRIERGTTVYELRLLEGNRLQLEIRPTEGARDDATFVRE